MCRERTVFDHLISGTFVEDSNWLERTNRGLKLKNGKFGKDAHELIVRFSDNLDWMSLCGSIRKWYYGATSLEDLTKKDLEKAWRKVATRLGISFDCLRTFEMSMIEIGQNVPLDMTCTEMIHRIRSFRSKCYELNDSRPTCRKFSSNSFIAKCYDKIAEINKENRNALIRHPEFYQGKNVLRIEFTLKGGHRRVLSRLKVGTLGVLLDEYNRVVNFFWQMSRKFFFDCVGQRPSFRPKRGSVKELTDFLSVLGLASLCHSELDGYIGSLNKEAQRDFRKRLRILHDREREYVTSDYQVEFCEAVKWQIVALIRKNARQRCD